MSAPVIAVANQKGGTGKTTCTLGLASAASHRGRRTLLLDVDPQANLTTAVAPEFNPEHEDSRTLKDLLAAKEAYPLDNVIIETKWANVDLVPAELDMAAADVAISDLPDRLSECLEASDLSAYDLVLIDCPPSVGRLLQNALVAATDCVLVTDAAADGLRGITNIENSIAKIRRLNPALRISGIIVNRYRKTAEQDFREQEIRAAYGPLVLEPHVSDRIAIAEAHASGLPVHKGAGEGARALASTFDTLFTQLETKTSIPREG